ncbi:MAG: hypothetical protein COA78_08405 [Blastopirellula sp.]|nr:MAG: hypothetical protein COA78_08405 [Blastopirellula sp.]
MSTSSNTSDQQHRVEENQGLVYSLAQSVHKKLPGQFGLDDLIAYGQIGLAQAAKTYDDSKGAAFSTFAYYRIRGAIYDGVSKMSWTSYAAQAQAKYQQHANDVMQAGVEDSPKTDKPEEADARWLGTVTQRLGIVYLASHSASETDAMMQVADEHTKSPAEATESKEVHQTLRQKVDCLPDDERKLIQFTYYEGLSLKEAGEKLGKSKSWASRLHQKILDRLAHEMRTSQ